MLLSVLILVCVNKIHYVVFMSRFMHGYEHEMAKNVDLSMVFYIVFHIIWANINGLHCLLMIQLERAIIQLDGSQRNSIPHLPWNLKYML